MRKIALVLVVLLAVAGICVMLWPVFTRHKLQADTDAAVQSFLEERKPEQQYPEWCDHHLRYGLQIHAEWEDRLCLRHDGHRRR